MPQLSPPMMTSRSAIWVALPTDHQRSSQNPSAMKAVATIAAKPSSTVPSPRARQPETSAGTRIKHEASGYATAPNPRERTAAGSVLPSMTK